MTVSPWFILLQAVTGSSPGFDLAKLKAPDECSALIAGQILVCGRQRSTPDRIASGPAIDDAMPKAETGLFGRVRGSLHGEQSSVGGFTSNRIMVTVSAPF